MNHSLESLAGETRLETVPFFAGSLPPQPVRPERLPFPVKFLLFYLAAITIFGKGPTYLGVGPIYMGEMMLVAIAGWCVLRRGLLRFLLPDETPLTWAVLGFMLLGALLTIPGTMRWGMDALRDAAIWYYAVFYLVGMEIARDTRLAERVWKVLAACWSVALVWVVAEYAAEHIFGPEYRPSQFSPMIPWRRVPVLSSSNYESAEHMVLGALIVFNPALRTRSLSRYLWFLFPLALAAMGIIGAYHGRGVKVGIGLAFLLIGTLFLGCGRAPEISRKLLVGLGCAVLLFAAGFAVAPEKFARATELDRFWAGTRESEGTTEFRMIWWKNLFAEVNRVNPATGLGFGKSLDSYNPLLNDVENDGWPTRSPHNINVTVFTRMGYLGAFLWTVILAGGMGTLFLHIWQGGWKQAYDPVRRERLTFWLAMLAATWGNSSFGVLMEGPVLGIWFWFALGFSRRLSQPQL